MLTKQSEQPSIYNTTFYSAIPFDIKTYTILIHAQHPAVLQKRLAGAGYAQCQSVLI